MLVYLVSPLSLCVAWEVVLWANAITYLCGTPTSGGSCLSVTWPFRAASSSLSPHPGKLSEMKSTWSPGPISHSQAPLSHELWKVPQGPRSTNTAPSRPPPGLTNTKPSSTWGGSSLGLAQGWSSSYTTGGPTVKYFWIKGSMFNISKGIYWHEMEFKNTRCVLSF